MIPRHLSSHPLGGSCCRRGLAGSTSELSPALPRSSARSPPPLFRYEVLERRDGGPGRDRPDLPRWRHRLACVRASSAPHGRVREISLRLTHPAAGIFGLGERYNAASIRWATASISSSTTSTRSQGLQDLHPDAGVLHRQRALGFHLATDSYSWFDFRLDLASRCWVSRPDEPRARLSYRISVNEQVAPVPWLAPASRKTFTLWALGPWMRLQQLGRSGRSPQEAGRAHRGALASPRPFLVIEAWSDEATFYIWNDATYAEKPGCDAFTYADFTFPRMGPLARSQGHGRASARAWPEADPVADPRHQADRRAAARPKQRDEEHFPARQGYGVHYPDGEGAAPARRLVQGLAADGFHQPRGRDWWFASASTSSTISASTASRPMAARWCGARDLRFADGTDGLLNRNRYPRDYIAAYYRFAQQNNGICFSRAGYTGAQTFPAHWAGDERSTWDAFKRSLLAGLSRRYVRRHLLGLGLCGLLGRSAERRALSARAQMACFCPIMQYHAESKAELNQDRTPVEHRRALRRSARAYRLRVLREPPHAALALARARGRLLRGDKTPLMRAMLLDPSGRSGRNQIVGPVHVRPRPARRAHDRGRRYLARSISPPAAGGICSSSAGTRLAGIRWSRRSSRSPCSCAMVPRCRSASTPICALGIHDALRRQRPAPPVELRPATPSPDSAGLAAPSCYRPLGKSGAEGCRGGPA